MPVSARFVADFNHVYAGLDKLTDKFEGVQRETQAAARQLDRMTKEFSGQKIVQQALSAAEAVERIGGTSKLTQAELSKLTGMATAARDKLALMGQDVPEKLRNLAAAADDGGKKVGLLQRAAALAGPALTAMVGTFTVGAVISAIRNTGTWAGRIDDLSKKMGISVEAVQRMDFAARKSGASIDAISTAMVFLSRQLIGGGTGTVDSLEKLNLTIEQLRRLAPEQQFITIAKAVAQMTDQNEKNAVTTALLGRGAADLIPIFGELESDMGEAVVANKSMIEAGDRLGDSWDKLMGAGTALIAGVLVPLEPLLTTAAGAAGTFAQKMFDISEASSRVLNQPGLLSRSGLGILRDIRKELHNIDVARMAGNVVSPGLPSGAPLSVLGPTDSEVRDIEKRSREIQKSIERIHKSVSTATPDIEISEKAFNRWWALMQAMPPAINDTGDEIRELGKTIAGANVDVMAKLIGATPGSITSQGISSTLAKAQGAFKSFFSGIKGGIQSLWEGISGGGGISGLFSNMGAGLIDKLGGMALTGITSFFGKIFGGDSKELKQAKAAYAEMQREAHRLGITLDSTFKLKSVQDYQKAIERAQAQINGFMDEQAADTERLQRAIEKYGLSLEELGPALQRQRLDEQAKELIEDWRVLVGAGVDLTVVNEKMAESIQDYLRMAIRTGTEVPAAMRPIIQSLIDQGKLTDENGNAITDMGQLGIIWSQTMTQGFDRVVQKLQELLDKLGLTAEAITGLPDAHVDIVYNDPGLPGGGGPPVDMQPVLSMSGAGLAKVDSALVSGGSGGGPSLHDSIVEAVKEGMAGATLYADGMRLTDVVARNQGQHLAFHGVR